MDIILGIDLGTTNSVASVIQEGKPVVIRDSAGESILPSVVGFDDQGNLLVGQEARNQALLAPERTVRSIKRRMGDDEQVSLGDASYAPREISAMILRTLKERAERVYDQPITKAVITVPAFFNDKQRQATKQAGELAGLEVLRIVNEPTAAALVYEPHSEKNERLLVYDLGGGTFDVSIVQIERGVVEVLSSHGDTHLGGDDFDQLLLDHVCDQFLGDEGIDLRDLPTARSRVLHAVEEAKKRLSFEAATTIAEEFIATRDGQPVNLNLEISRRDYEELILPLVRKTIECVDAALEDCKLTHEELDRVILVGGSSRTPLVQDMLKRDLRRELHLEVDPDLCVAMGAAVQGGLIAGVDVGTVLVDITPHTLGVECVGLVDGIETPHCFSAIIPRNTPLPAVRSEIYYTGVQGQKRAAVHVLQGENDVATLNASVGKFMLEGLDESADINSEILVRFKLDLNGILTVTAIERTTSLEKQVAMENAITSFRAKDRDEAKAKLASIFGEETSVVTTAGDGALVGSGGAAERESDQGLAGELLAKARRLVHQAPSEDADEIRELVATLQSALGAGDTARANGIMSDLEDLLFYLEDA